MTNVPCFSPAYQLNGGCIDFRCDRDDGEDLRRRAAADDRGGLVLRPGLRGQALPLHGLGQPAAQGGFRKHRKNE